MKNLISVKFLLLLYMAFAILSCSKDEVQTGTLDSLTWSISNDILTISGTGAIPDYDYPQIPPWPTTIKQVIIGGTVNSIGQYAFFRYMDITSITIGNSVTHIQKDAFSMCNRLTSLTIGNSVMSIGESAFYGGYSVKSVTIPQSVISIGEFAFGQWHELKDIYVERVSPSTCTNDPFYEVNRSTCTLHVPVGSKQAYSTAKGWKEFTVIKEDVNLK